jgi:hypothetical protein
MLLIVRPSKLEPYDLSSLTIVNIWPAGTPAQAASGKPAQACGGAVEVGVDVGEGELFGGGAVAPGWVKIIVQLLSPSPSTPRVTVTLAAPGALGGFTGLRDLYAVPEA